MAGPVPDKARGESIVEGSGSVEVGAIGGGAAAMFKSFNLLGPSVAGKRSLSTSRALD
jgi:hypothetical protein